MSSSSLLTEFKRLVDIVAELREKCPWDRVQTKESLRHLTIEETYELADAILQNDYEEIKVELGDLLLHILFYAKLGEEKQEFDLTSVITSQADKLIRRHPHIYGDLKAETAEQVKDNWEQIKAREKPGKQRKKTLSGVPSSLPSLIKAYRMQKKAANVGFDWDKPEDVWAKVQEELAEFTEADSVEDREAEMGDLLFSLVNYCRFEGINPDDALSRTNEKFQRRFEYVEDEAHAGSRDIHELTLEEMEALWKVAKNEGL